MTTLNHGEYTQKAIEDGCKLKIVSEDYYSELRGNSIGNNWSVTLVNEAGKDLLSSTSRVSRDKALDSLEGRLRARAREREEAVTPFAKLLAEVRHITDMRFNNNDKAHHLSTNATRNGWDISRDSDFVCNIRIHNAANTVIWFDMFQPYSVVQMNLVNMRTWGINQEMQALPELLDAINDYLYVDMDKRKAEFAHKLEEAK